MSKPRWSLIPALACLMLSSTGCVIAFGPDGPLNAVKSIRKELKVSGTPEVVVESRQGEVSITAGDGDLVEVEGEARAADDESLAKIEMNAAVEGNMVKVGWSTTDGSFRGRQLNFKIKVPRGCGLKVSTGAGGIQVAGTRGGLVARTGAGSIRSEGVVGAQDLDSGAGSLDVKGAMGSVAAVSRAGAVSVEGALSGRNRIESNAGRVVLRLTGENNLRVEGSTGAGSVRNDFGWPISGNVSERVEGVVGDGKAGTVTLRSSAGGVEILRGK